MFDRFLQRVDERVNIALAMLDQPHDFAIDEEMIRDADAATFAKTPEEAAGALAATREVRPA